MKRAIGRLACGLGLHRWEVVRVITKMSLRDGSVLTGLTFTVDESERRTECARCRQLRGASA